MTLPRPLRALLLAGLLTGAGLGAARAQETASDAVAKARFTLTLARFVQWPADRPGSEAGPMRLCLLHRSGAVAEAFAALEGQRVAGQVLSVQSNPRDLAPCALLFVDASAAQGGAGVVAAAAGRPALTLGATDGFLSQGGMVELTQVDERLRFDVNLRALRSARLALSSQVLRLARQVRE